MSLVNPIIEPIGYPVQTEAVPDYLVKEEIEGIKYYYKGYKDVLNKIKTKEEIMGCSSLQSFIIDAILEFLYSTGTKRKYLIFTNESGNHLAHKTNMQFDIALYDRDVLTAEKISRKYVQGVAPSLVIEVDLDIELEDTDFSSPEEFILVRTQHLIDFGVKKVLWVLTKPKKIVIAEGKSWQIEDWDKDIEILKGSKFNLVQYFVDYGFNLDAI